MPTFVFKKKLSPHIFQKFLEPICIKAPTHYIVNYETLKRARFNTHYDDFIELLRPYYYPSNQHYIDAPIEYKRFLTILRQICNFNNIAYTVTLAYDRSKASVEYHIYYASFTEPIDTDDSTLLPK